MGKLAKGYRLLACLFVGGIGSLCARADTLTLAVAANFSGAAKMLAAEFEKNTTHAIKLAYGSTGAHYAQIKQGAPFDIFFAADQRTPELLEKENLIIPDSRFTYAHGRLVLWSRKPSLINNSGKVLTSKNFKHLAIANPKLAPYGAAAQQVLMKLDVFEQLRTRLVQGENISQTYLFVASGAADLGFIALSQLMPSGNTEPPTGSSWLVPENLYSPIEQQAVLLRDTAAAREFIDFVKSEAGRNIIQGMGYSVSGISD